LPFGGGLGLPSSKGKKAGGKAAAPDARARAVAYVAKCAPAVSGQGGHNQTYAVAVAVVWGFDLGPDLGFDLLWAEYNPRCQPPWSEAELRHKCADAATKHHDRARGWLLHEANGLHAGGDQHQHQHHGGDGGDRRDPEDGGEKKPKTGYQIILAYFREHYRPLFKRGTTLYSDRFSREVKPGEACYGPGIQLVDLLEHATDAPKINKSGAVDRAALPYFFQTWARSAWVDLIGPLRNEEQSDEVSGSASDEFRGKVAAGLFSQATYGVDRGGDMRQERRSLLQWCQFWAKPGGWQQVRSALLWCRKDDDGRLCVALRVSLFGQFGPPALAGLTQRKFADLAELYGVGAADRACHNRVVVLAQEFLAEVLTGPAAAGDEGTGTEVAGARTRETCVPPSPDGDFA
jgi:hypothetical protein